MFPRVADREDALESGSWRDTQWWWRGPIHSVPGQTGTRLRAMVDQGVSLSTSKKSKRIHSTNAESTSSRGRGCCVTVARTNHVTGIISSSSITESTPLRTTEGSQTGRLLRLSSTHLPRPGTSAPTARSQSLTLRLPVPHRVGVGTTSR